VIACAMAALASCASDNTRYACAGYPSQPLCLPPSAIYALTQGAGPAPTAQPRPSTVGAPARTGDEAPWGGQAARTPAGARP
jgi:hypothetical protein